MPLKHAICINMPPELSGFQYFVQRIWTFAVWKSHICCIWRVLHACSSVADNSRVFCCEEIDDFLCCEVLCLASAERICPSIGEIYPVQHRGHSETCDLEEDWLLLSHSFHLCHHSTIYSLIGIVFIIDIYFNYVVIWNNCAIESSIEFQDQFPLSIADFWTKRNISDMELLIECFLKHHGEGIDFDGVIFLHTRGKFSWWLWQCLPKQFLWNPCWKDSDQERTQEICHCNQFLCHSEWLSFLLSQ